MGLTLWDSPHLCLVFTRRWLEPHNTALRIISPNSFVVEKRGSRHVPRSREWRGRPPRAPLSPSVAMKPVFPFILPLNLYFIRTIITRRSPNAMNIVNIINDRSILDWSSHCVDLQLDEALSSGFLSSSSSPLSVVSKAHKTTQSALKSRGGGFSLFVENGEI